MFVNGDSGRCDILFLLYPAYGHVVPNLPVIEELVRRGRRVSATVSEHFAPAVERAGGTALIFDPPFSEMPSLAGMTMEKWAEASYRLFLDTIGSGVSIEQVVATGRPGVICYDSTMWAPARVVSARSDTPVIHMVPTFVDNEPFTTTSMRIGEPNEEEERRRLAEFGEGMVELFGQHGLPGVTTRDLAARDDEHSVVYVPREFQPDEARFGDRYTFAGPCLPRPESPPEWTPPVHDPPILLVSLGTVSNDRLSLFTECIDAFADSPWHLVLTLGGRIDISELGTLPDNVEAHRWVRHPEVLAHADAYVSQAGMGSVMEALAHAVPIVATPGHPEQTSNAMRLVELGLGRHLDNESVTAATVWEAVDSVVNDEGISARLDWMRRSIERAGGTRVAADAIERQLSNSITKGDL